MPPASRACRRTPCRRRRGWLRIASQASPHRNPRRLGLEPEREVDRLHPHVSVLRERDELAVSVRSGPRDLGLLERRCDPAAAMGAARRSEAVLEESWCITFDQSGEADELAVLHRCERDGTGELFLAPVLEGGRLDGDLERQVCPGLLRQLV